MMTPYWLFSPSIFAKAASPYDKSVQVGMSMCPRTYRRCVSVESQARRATALIYLASSMVGAADIWAHLLTSKLSSGHVWLCNHWSWPSKLLKAVCFPRKRGVLGSARLDAKSSSSKDLEACSCETMISVSLTCTRRPQKMKSLSLCDMRKTLTRSSRSFAVVEHLRS